MEDSFSFLRSIHLTHEQDKELAEEFLVMVWWLILPTLLLCPTPPYTVDHLMAGNNPMYLCRLDVSCVTCNSKPYGHSSYGWVYCTLYSRVWQQSSHYTRQEVAVWHIMVEIKYSFMHVKLTCLYCALLAGRPLTNGLYSPCWCVSAGM